MKPRVNVGETERLVSTIGGGALALWGLARRGLTGVLLGLVGGGLADRGLTGHCPVYQALGVDTARRDEAAPEADALIQQASEDSFPASDAPAWTRTTRVGEPPR